MLPGASTRVASTIRLTILGRADHFDQLVFGDGITDFAAENIVQSRLGTPLVSQTQEVLFGILDSPPAKGVDDNVRLVFGRHFVGTAIPFQDAFLDPVDFLDKRYLESQARLGHRLSDRLTELGDDHLFGFGHGVGSAE